MAAKHNPGMPDLAALLALETRVWQALVAGDPQADGAMLTADFLGVYPDGFADRAAHMAMLANGPTMRTFALDAARLVPLGPDRALLSYRATCTPAAGGPARVMYVSSIWERRGDGWLNSFSQDTPAAD